MNVIDYTIQHITRMDIPQEILDLAFPYNELTSDISLSERITSEVIKPIVLTDLNLMSGISTEIELRDCIITEDNTYRNEFLIRVPKYLTDDRDIIAAESIIGMPFGAVPLGSLQRGRMCSPMPIRAANRMVETSRAYNHILCTDLEVIGSNLILVHNFSGSFKNGYLKCDIEHSPELETISRRYYNKFLDLTIAAVKTYIYNNTVIELDEGEVYGGHTIGAIKDIISGYADQYDIYKELRSEWKKLSIMMDKKKYNRLLKSTISGRL